MGGISVQLRDIQYAVTIADEMSFSRAAHKLFISQPALSQSIRKLERELGLELFKREGNSLRLTPAGRLFIMDGQEILRMSNTLKAKMTDIVSMREEKLTVGISPFYSSYYLPLIIPEFRRLYPNIHLELVEEHTYNLEKLVGDGVVDFCLIPAAFNNPDVEEIVVYREQILLAVPAGHPVNEAAPVGTTGLLPLIDLHQVRDEPFIFLKKRQKFSRMGMQLCADAGFEPKIVLETMNWNTVNTLVSTGIGVGFVPEILVNTHVPGNQPVYYRIMAEKTTRPYVVAYPRGSALTVAAHNFIRVAKESFRLSDANRG